MFNSKCQFKEALSRLCPIRSRGSTHTTFILFLVVASLIIIQNTTLAAEENKNQQCTLYMAPTSTLGPDSNTEPAKLSMYAGINFKPGQIIGRPEIAIPLIHLKDHIKFGTGHGEEDFDQDETTYFDTIENFMWNSAAVSAQYEVDHEDSLLMCIPGVGSLGNQHPTLLYNADWDFNANVDRTTRIDAGSPTAATTTTTTTKNPGRGSTSHFYDMTLIAKDNIPQGMEILVTGLGLEPNPDLHTMEEFKHADKSIQQIYEFMTKHYKALSSNFFSGLDKKQKLYDFLLKDVMEESDNDLFPDDVNDILNNMDYADDNELGNKVLGGGTFVKTYPEVVKSISWLEEHGQCIDGLYVKESTLLSTTESRQFGAFATRSYKKGDVVTATPLIMIPDKTYLEMYELGGDDSVHGDKSKNNVMSHQLIMNYSFGHPESSLMFYPYGVNVNYINHQSSRSHSTIGEAKAREVRAGANVKLVWTKAKYHQDEYLEYSPENLRLRHDDEIVFSFGMDIVATRDIEADEEIFLDYGTEWERKWDDHLEKSNEEEGEEGQDGSSNFKALELNSMMKNSSPSYSYFSYFYTADEVMEMSDAGKYHIPDSVMTTCYVTMEDLDKNDKLHLSKKKKPKNEIWSKFGKETVKNGAINHVCEILERHEVESVGTESSDGGSRKEYEYTVVIPSHEDGKRQIVYNVPQSFIKYTDKPYTSHVHSRKGFRHYIGIPDEIFPQAWRDL